MKIKDTELAWAAGFLDGEGTFGIQRQKDRKPYLYVQAGQTDRQVLDRLQEAIGGKVYGPYVQKNPKHKPYFYFRITGNEKTKIVWETIWEWLSPVKREQALEAERKLSGTDEDTGLNPAAANHGQEFDSLSFR